MEVNKKSKLCYILPEYNPKTPTHFAHLYDFIEKLRESFDVFLVIEKAIGWAEVVGRTEVAPPSSEVRPPKIYVQKFKFPPLRCLENFLVLLKARLKGYKNFYIHYSFLSAFNASLIAKIFNGKVFYWNCGLPWNYQKGARVIFEKLVYKMISFLVTGTESLKIEYSKHYKIPLKKIKVMPNWVSIQKIRNQKFQPEAGPPWAENIQNQKVVLFAHRLSQRKGAHFLPEIINNLKDENIVLLIVGDGPEKQNLEFRIQDLGLSDKVKFLGWIPNEEIYQYYAIADVFIMPSEEEGFPRVLLETMAMGVPFVSSDVGGVKEIVPPEFLNYVVKIGDTEVFSQKIKELLNLPQEKLKELKTIEKNWVQKYDLSQVIEIFKGIILSSEKFRF